MHKKARLCHNLQNLQLPSAKLAAEVQQAYQANNGLKKDTTRYALGLLSW